MFSDHDLPILGILRNIKEKEITPLIQVFTNTSLRFIEITLNTPNATSLIKRMAEEAGDKLVIGAGTVLDEKGMHEALDCGAQFIVCPSTKKEIVEYCAKSNVPVFPGALSPTEVHQAWDFGATMVKLFPSGMFGPGYIKALKGPFDQIKLMAVGGITEANIAKYMSHGADAVAFGAGIIRPTWMEQEKYDIIEEKIKQLISNCKSV